MFSLWANFSWYLLVMYGCCLRINTFQWLPWSLPCWFALWCYIFVVSAVYTISLHRISSHTHITLMCHIPNLLLVTFLVFDCTETGEDGRVWDAQGEPPVRWWGPVKSWRNVGRPDLGQIIWGHQLLLGCFLFGHRTCSDTGATFQAGVKWWNWCGWDTGPRRKKQNSWYLVFQLICIESWQLSRNYPQMVVGVLVLFVFFVFFRWYVNTFLWLYTVMKLIYI